MSEKAGFRPDLEGLRAVAVILVLLYHAAIPGFPGGYIGVDVFFVLSGFLITGLLVRELASTGRISFPAFYARRARRLLPAAALTLLVTAVVSALVLPPLRVPDITADTAAAALYSSNLRFAFQATNYLASDLPPSPVLHFWSLGVEEQFYLFWPALLMLVSGAAFAAGQVTRGVQRITITLGVVLASSLVLAIWLTGVQQPWAFFSLPTRAWELALGGLLAVPAAGRLVPTRLAPSLTWLGLGLVTLSGIVLNEATPFPGTAALLPTVGSALVIAGGLVPRSLEPGASRQRIVPRADRLLSLPPVRFLGRISYSLYLWHWPILVLPAAVAGDRLPGVVRVALAGLSILVAAASQRWVEDPIRHGRLIGTRPRRVLAIAGALTITVAASGLALGSMSQTGLQSTGPTIGGSADDVPLPPLATRTPDRPEPSGSAPGTSPGNVPSQAPATLPPLARAPVPADLVPSLAAARDDLPVIYSDGCHLDPAATTSGSCVFGDTRSSTTIVLFGDSHAAQWFPAFERLALTRQWRLVSLTKSACASADVPVWTSQFNRAYTECDTWRKAALERIATEHPALVVTSNDHPYTLALDGQRVSSSDHPDVWTAGLRRTLDRLVSSAGAVVLIGDTTRMRQSPPECLSQHLDDASACATPYRAAIANNDQADEQRVATAAGATFIDPTPLTCFSDPCPAVIGRFLVYRDVHHMTATYARALASPLFELLPAIGP